MGIEQVQRLKKLPFKIKIEEDQERFQLYQEHISLKTKSNMKIRETLKNIEFFNRMIGVAQPSKKASNIFNNRFRSLQNSDTAMDEINQEDSYNLVRPCAEVENTPNLGTNHKIPLSKISNQHKKECKNSGHTTNLNSRIDRSTNYDKGDFIDENGVKVDVKIWLDDQSSRLASSSNNRDLDVSHEIIDSNNYTQKHSHLIKSDAKNKLKRNKMISQIMTKNPETEQIENFKFSSRRCSVLTHKQFIPKQAVRNSVFEQNEKIKISNLSKRADNPQIQISRRSADKNDKSAYTPAVTENLTNNPIADNKETNFSVKDLILKEFDNNEDSGNLEQEYQQDSSHMQESFNNEQIQSIRKAAMDPGKNSNINSQYSLANKEQQKLLDNIVKSKICHMGITKEDFSGIKAPFYSSKEVSPKKNISCMSLDFQIDNLRSSKIDLSINKTPMINYDRFVSKGVKSSIKQINNSMRNSQRFVSLSNIANPSSKILMSTRPMTQEKTMVEILPNIQGYDKTLRQSRKKGMGDTHKFSKSINMSVNGTSATNQVESSHCSNLVKGKKKPREKLWQEEGYGNYRSVPKELADPAFIIHEQNKIQNRMILSKARCDDFYEEQDKSPAKDKLYKNYQHNMDMIDKKLQENREVWLDGLKKRIRNFKFKMFDNNPVKSKEDPDSAYNSNIDHLVENQKKELKTGKEKNIFLKMIQQKFESITDENGGYKIYSDLLEEFIGSNRVLQGILSQLQLDKDKTKNELLQKTDIEKPQINQEQNCPKDQRRLYEYVQAESIKQFLKSSQQKTAEADASNSTTTNPINLNVADKITGLSASKKYETNNSIQENMNRRKTVVISNNVSPRFMNRGKTVVISKDVSPRFSMTCNRFDEGATINHFRNRASRIVNLAAINELHSIVAENGFFESQGSAYVTDNKNKVGMTDFLLRKNEEEIRRNKGKTCRDSNYNLQVIGVGKSNTCENEKKVEEINNQQKVEAIQGPQKNTPRYEQKISTMCLDEQATKNFTKLNNKKLAVNSHQIQTPKKTIGCQVKTAIDNNKKIAENSLSSVVDFTTDRFTSNSPTKEDFDSRSFNLISKVTDQNYRKKSVNNSKPTDKIKAKIDFKHVSNVKIREDIDNHRRGSLVNVSSGVTKKVDKANQYNNQDKAINDFQEYTQTSTPFIEKIWPMIFGEKISKPKIVKKVKNQENQQSQTLSNTIFDEEVVKSNYGSNTVIEDKLVAVEKCGIMKNSNLSFEEEGVVHEVLSEENGNVGQVKLSKFCKNDKKVEFK